MDKLRWTFNQLLVAVQRRGPGARVGPSPVDVMSFSTRTGPMKHRESLEKPTALEGKEKDQMEPTVSSLLNILAEMLTTQGFVGKILSERTGGIGVDPSNNESGRHSEDLVDALHLLLSIPDRAANALNGATAAAPLTVCGRTEEETEMPSVLYPHAFHREVCAQAFEWLASESVSAAKIGLAAAAAAAGKVSLLVNLLVHRGYAEHCTDHIAQQLWRMAQEDQDAEWAATIHVWHRMFAELQPFALERICERLLGKFASATGRSHRAKHVRQDKHRREGRKELGRSGEYGQRWQRDLALRIFTAIAVRFLNEDRHPVFMALFTSRFLCEKVFPRGAIGIIQSILFAAAAAASGGEVLQCSRELVFRRWADPSFVLMASEAEQEANGCAVMGFLRHDALAKADLLVLTGDLINGVQHRLGSPAVFARRWAAIVARQFSILMLNDTSSMMRSADDVPASSPELIDFDEFPNAMEQWVREEPEEDGEVEIGGAPKCGRDDSKEESVAEACTAAAVNDDDDDRPEGTHHNNKTRGDNDDGDEVEEEDPDRPLFAQQQQHATISTGDKPHQNKTAQMQPPPPPPLAVATAGKGVCWDLVKNNGNKADQEQEDDECSSLPAFDLHEEDDRDGMVGDSENAVRPQKYLALALEVLCAAKEDVDAIDGCLQSLQRMVETQPDDLETYACALTRVLLHRQDTLNIARFAALRIGSLVALAVHAPTLVVPYITSQFYLEQYNVSQRIDMLQVLGQAAQQLATTTKAHEGPSASTSTADPPLLQPRFHSSNQSRQRRYPPMNSSQQQQQNDYGENVERRVQQQKQKLESQTRRWGQRRTPAPAITRNAFVPYAPMFTLNLLKDFDQGWFRLDTTDDVYVLGKLLHTLGTFIECCALHWHVLQTLVPAVLDFLWRFRSHPNKFIRARLLGAVLQCFEAIPAELCDEEILTLALTWGEWLNNDSARQDISGGGAGEADAELAVLTFSVMGACHELIQLLSSTKPSANSNLKWLPPQQQQQQRSIVVVK